MYFKRCVYTVLAILPLTACVESSGDVGKTDSRPEAARSKSIQRVTENNPFYYPGICRKIYIQTKSETEARNVAQAKAQNLSLVSGNFGVYQLFNRDYVAAYAIESLDDKNLRFRKGDYRRSSENLRYSKSSGRAHPTARCTDGADIRRDTGTHYIKENKRYRTGLIEEIIVGTGRILQDAANNPAPSGGGYTPVPQDAASAPAEQAPTKGIRQVYRDGRTTVIECADGRKRKVYHDTYGKCSIPSTFGSYSCAWAIEDTKKSCY